METLTEAQLRQIGMWISGLLVGIGSTMIVNTVIEYRTKLKHLDEMKARVSEASGLGFEMGILAGRFSKETQGSNN